MSRSAPIFATPLSYLIARKPDLPVHFFAPSVLTEKVASFRTGFPGMTTFAVKSNPAPSVLAHLLAQGIEGFDVASPAEIAAVRSLSPDAALHYHNPVRSTAEIAFAADASVRVFSVDTLSELEKLRGLVPICGTEISVRFKLPVKGAAYDFGDKFGATPKDASDLLRRAADLGFTPSLTFHPGTQCDDPQAYDTYVRAAIAIADAAECRIARLNVGGGFPSARSGGPVDLAPYFAAITRAAHQLPPGTQLVCEPGRGLVSDAFQLAVRVKSLRPGVAYLNDGIYGGLSEALQIGPTSYRVFSETGTLRRDDSAPMAVFGPTCDSLDRLPGRLPMPSDLAEGDYILFQSMGAYVTGVSTEFNGYGHRETVLVKSL